LKLELREKTANLLNVAIFHDEKIAQTDTGVRRTYDDQELYGAGCVAPGS
jgi:hypothetical protein